MTTQQRTILTLVRRVMLYSLIGSMLCLTGCRKETRNTFQAALADSTPSGYVLIEQGQLDKSGYAILGDSTHPKSKVAFILFAECHDDSYQGPDKAIPAWASVLRITYALDNGQPSDVNFNPDGQGRLHPVVPVKDIFEKWAPQWYKFSTAEGIPFTDHDKSGFERAVELSSETFH
jgi:hypothetical protein